MDDSVWRLTGVPMGWTWAPAIAQAVSLALIRLTLRRLPEHVRREVHVQYAYIDNIIFALKDDKVAAEVDKAWREVCEQFGVSIKESDTVNDKTVDWLGVLITAGTRAVTFRKRFLDKLTETWDQCRKGEIKTARAWWRLIALAVHVMWTMQRPLTSLIQPLRWLSRTAKAMDAGEVNWSTTVVPWKGVEGPVGEAFEMAHQGFEVFAAPDTTIVHGQSDAAGEGYSAFVVRYPDGKVTAARAGATPQVHINRGEARIALAGIRWSLQQAPAAGGVVQWKSDNTTAVAWLQRRWSSEWDLNEAIDVLDKTMKEATARLEISHVPGVKCVPDVMTRCAVAPGQSCKAPAEYCFKWNADCACADICEHVAEAVKQKAMDKCKASGCHDAQSAV
jgi:hypothetical protein